jgi:sigma-B regulation protein RsbU (phosphoserine phosphatase)
MNMSLRTKIGLAFASVLLAVGLFVLFFVRADVEQIVYDAEARQVDNVLDLMELNLQGRYQSLLMDKLEAVEQRKAALRRISGLALSAMSRFAAARDAGRMDPPMATDYALSVIENLELSPDRYLFALSPEGRIVASSDADLLGRSLAGFRDIKGRELTGEVADAATTFGETMAIIEFAVHGQPSRKVCLVSDAPTWGWLLVAAVELEDLAREQQRRIADIIAVFGETLSEITLAETGSVMLFDDQGEVLAAPAGLPSEAARRFAQEHAGADRAGQASFTFRAADEDYLAELRSFRSLGWRVAALVPVEELADEPREIVTYLTLVLALAFAVGGLVAIVMAGRISRPLMRLAGYAEHVHEQDFTAADAEPTPLLAELARRHSDEVGRLAESFLFMERSLKERVRELMEATAQAQAIESELTIAREIQQGLLPKIFPPYPDRPEIDLHAHLDSAREVGGDLYDFFFLDENRLCFVAGDVAGKGVPASLFMAITMALLKQAVEYEPDPARIIARVNDALSHDNPSGMFVTLFLGVLDLRDGGIEYVNAGHNPPAIVGGAGVDYLRGPSGPMLGAFADMPYEKKTASLEPGQAILVYTDGITEAMNPEHALFGEERLTNVLHDVTAAPSREVVQAILAAVEAHAAGADQSDDITVLCLRRSKTPGEHR